jgi:hypothetical protein
MSRRLAALALLGGLFALHATAQDKKSSPADTPKPQRTHYVVRHADPVVLAEVVGRHFRGEADVIAAPAGSGGALLISGSPTAVPEVVKLLEQLDRKPRTVEVEIVIAEIPATKDGKDVNLTGDLLAEVAQSKSTTTQRIKLTAVEGQPVSTQTGGDKPYVSGAGGGAWGGKGGGPVQRSISYRPVGTTVKLTARVGAEDAVSLDLNLAVTQVRPPDVADESGSPVFENGSLTTKVNVPAGKAVAVHSVRTEVKSGGTLALVVVTARVVDPDAPKGK